MIAQLSFTVTQTAVSLQILDSKAVNERDYIYIPPPSDQYNWTSNSPIPNRLRPPIQGLLALNSNQEPIITLVLVAYKLKPKLL